MKRNKFNLSHYKLLTCNQGELIPLTHFEVIPGDTIQQATNMLIRVAPLNAPVMHPVQARVHHWFVPYRKIWEDFEDFITGGDDGLDASVHPYKSPGSTAIGSLYDYFNVPPGVAGMQISALPFRAYAFIWNEHYRHPDLQTELTIDETSGYDSTTNVSLQSVQWEKDYFTSAHTDTQKGDEVTLPLGSSAPVIGDSDGATATAAWSDGAGNMEARLSSTATTQDLIADLSGATAATINELREAFALQRYAEARQRYGSRYVEYLRYLGVRSSDLRLDRPEYLGGGRQSIQFSEIVQTGVDSSDAGVGQLAGHGIAGMRTNRYRKFFEEHGIVMSLLSVKPRTIYTQGLHRSWSRETKEDYFQRELQHIGMEPIYNREVYAAHSSPDDVFGYQDRYQSYREIESSVAGEFRNSGGLEHWHMGRIFSSDPALNSSFVEANPTNRIYQATGSDQLYIMANHSIQARRMISRTGAPGGV
jgi:hypothetical protein